MPPERDRRDGAGSAWHSICAAPTYVFGSVCNGRVKLHSLNMPVVEKSVDVRSSAETVNRCLLGLRRPPALPVRSSDEDPSPAGCRRSIGPASGEICWRYASPRMSVRAMSRRLTPDTTRLILQAECPSTVASMNELRTAIEGALTALKQELEGGSTGS